MTHDERVEELAEAARNVLIHQRSAAAFERLDEALLAFDASPGYDEDYEPDHTPYVLEDDQDPSQWDVGGSHD